MTLIKKIDAERHFAERRASRKDAALFVVHSNATASSGAEPAKARPAAKNIAGPQNPSSSSALLKPFLMVAESDRNPAMAAPGSWSV
jgi:hypothetical protein